MGFIKPDDLKALPDHDAEEDEVLSDNESSVVL
jgi:hypothetical protein